MRIKKIMAIACAGISLATLLSMGCGVLAFPVEAPKIAAVNTKVLTFKVDIVDDTNKPLDAVSVTVIKHALAPDFWMVETDESKSDPPRTISGTFNYATFGNYAVVVTYAKPGYATVTCAYALEDNVEIHQKAAFMAPLPVTPNIDDRINTFAHPHTTVILHAQH